MAKVVRMGKVVARLGFLVLVLGGGLAIGVITAPGQWYAALNKPPFNPPNWPFGPVWSVLYIAIAVVGWRLWESARSSGTMRLWWLQLALNFLWSPVFFVMQQPTLALVVIVLLLATLLVFIWHARSTDRLSAALFVPYLAWVLFASALNLSIVMLN